MSSGAGTGHSAADSGADVHGPVQDNFSSLFEFLPIGAYRSSPQGHMLRGNPALQRLNGFGSEAELLAVRDIARDWYVDPARREQFMQELERDGQVTGFESEVYRYKTRERIWVSENAHAVRNAQGQVLFYEGTVEEISDRVAAREALRRSREELRQIVELVPGMVYRVLILPDGDRRATYVSPGVRELFELEPEDILSDGRLMHRLRHVEDRPRIEAATTAATRSGTPLELEYRVQLHSGTTKWVHVISAQAPPEQGNGVRVGMVFDVTARKQAEQALLASEARLQQLVTLIPGIVYRLVVGTDGKLRYTYVSDHVRDVYGLEPEEVLADGEAMVRLRHPDDRARVTALSNAGLQQQRSLHYETRVLLRDGTEKWIEVFSIPAPDEDGCAVRVGVLMDITQRKRAELALAEQAEVWKRAMESTGDGVWDWHIQAGIEQLSPHCKAMYGFAPDELPDLPSALDELTHPDDVAQMLVDRDAHFSGQTPRYVNEHRVRCKDGQWKWVLSRGIVISRDAKGAPLRMIGTHTDITAAKQAQALRLERDSAAAADLAKSQFLSRVSHELRTPLNAILGFAQLLELEPGAGERQQDWTRHVLSSGRHLLALMDDILDLSSVQTGHLSMRAEPVPLRAAIEEAWTMLAGSAHNRQIVFINHVPSEEGCQLLADRRRLKQILSNLLSNAIKYNRDGGWVRVTAAVADGAVELQVVDSGPGLDERQQARLFVPFERVGAERGPVAGTGLGLALSRQLAEAMGGTLEVCSRAGEGATFMLRLPAA